jgi:3-oxoisoapionate decarboxylase
MNLKDINLSIYSFGYSAGFIHDKRPEMAEPTVSIDSIASLAEEHSLGGIEFPIDRYFPLDNLSDAVDFIEGLRSRHLRAAIDLETFDPEYIERLIPILLKADIGWARIKMSGFYGGNRYLEPEFEGWVRDFKNTLFDLIPTLRKAGLMLLIENHQDLGADDLVKIISTTAADCIGINWDVGNSLPVPDTPETFLEKTAGFIGNVHLKDYRLFRSENGYRMARCPLGEGIVDFSSLLPRLHTSKSSIPMAIELGAQNARHADIFETAYWEAYPPVTVAEKIPFFAFLNRHLEDGDDWKSTWEQDLSGADIIADEMKDLEKSVAYLNTLEI